MPERGSDEEVLLLAACAGHRCAGLLRDADEQIRTAIRGTPHAVLMQLPCLGRCERGAMALLGPANAVEGRARWRARPVLLDNLDTQSQRGLQRVHALCDRISRTA